MNNAIFVGMLKMNNRERVALLAANMRDAVITPTAEGARAFRELGISVTDSTGRLRTTDAVFEEVVARFAQMQDGAQKMAIAYQLFGRYAHEVIIALSLTRSTTALK